MVTDSRFLLRDHRVVKRFLVSLLTVLLVTWEIPLHAATATAGSGEGAVRNATGTGSASWHFFNPSPADQITWTSGINHTDGTEHPKEIEGIEFKFQFPPNPGDDFTGTIFTGFEDLDGGPAPARSEAITRGRGLSEGITGFFGTRAVARWTVTATGKLAGRSGASWDSQASGEDPFALTSEAFESVNEPFYDLFFEVGLTGGNISSAGTIAFDVAYETSAVSRTLLHILLDATGARVSNDGSGDVRLFLLSGFEEGPTEIAANLTDLLSIESMLGSDIAVDLTLDNPMYLGILLEDLAVPTEDLGDGSLARLHVDLSVSDADVRDVSEPYALGLCVAGLVILRHSLHRRRDRHL